MTVKNKFILTLSILISINFASCKEYQKNQDGELLDGKTILEKCIENHGGSIFNSSNIKLTTNDIDYEMVNYQYKVKYSMRKFFNKDLHVVNYDRGYVQYFINDSLRNSNAYNNFVVNTRLDNFLYLLSIPFNLDFNGTITERLEDVTIRSKDYYSIHISFPKIEDVPENEFILYIDKESFQMSFLALKYNILGSSISFRRFMNPRTVDGVMFQDYISFTPKEDSNATLQDLYIEYNKATLKDAKPIKLKKISVSPITQDPF